MNHSRRPPPSNVIRFPMREVADPATLRKLRGFARALDQARVVVARRIAAQRRRGEISN